MTGLKDKVLMAHQEQVIEEANQLKQKINQLHALFKGPAWALVPINERTLYTAQSRAMLSYYGTLQKRIELFT